MNVTTFNFNRHVTNDESQITSYKLQVTTYKLLRVQADSQVVQTVWFLEGNDEGAERNQRPFVIQEAGRRVVQL